CQLLGKQLIVVIQIIPEQRKRLNKGSTTGHDFGTATREQIYGSEILIDAHRIVGTQNRDSPRKSTFRGNRSGRCQDNGGRRHGVVGTVMFADSEYIQAELIG